MKVILGCDPLLAPLTGIGNYTQQIAKGLASSERVDEFKLFAHGKFFSDDIYADNKIDTVSIANSSTLLAQARSSLAKSELAVSIYSKVVPLIEKVKLTGYQDFVFHSPNFILPNFSGRKIVTIHDLSTLKFPQFHPASRVKFVNAAIERAVKSAEHFITDTEFIRNELIHDFALPAEKVSAIPLAASKHYSVKSEGECTQVLSRFDLHYRGFFLFVSTIEPRKNLMAILEAMEAYASLNKHYFPLVIVGGKGWNSDAIHTKIEHLQRKGVVRYFGYVEQHYLEVLFSSAKALVFPSQYEGFGLPVLEAMQSGTPVLTSCDSAMSEVVGQAGILVQHEDPNDIKQGLVKLSYDDGFVTSITRKGLHRASEFSWKKTVEKTLDVYEKRA
ncbi:glycosyltransferase family 4 protein [Pseudoalteromonas spongiae]|uniref:glycosyltransferase family 4 protein n=1 Tax=Pseudoalteromonas spongiae TaxID=298657 RepID=UPI000C2D4628|nr:glycosyltransferase family 1 protein [Pseudoalteromonas spongiae]